MCGMLIHLFSGVYQALHKIFLLSRGVQLRHIHAMSGFTKSNSPFLLMLSTRYIGNHQGRQQVFTIPWVFSL